MQLVLGAVADDFTGATDIASLLARAEVPVTLRIGVPRSPEPSAPFEVIALKSRTSPVGEAVAETQAALAWLRAAGAQRFYWKYCSTFDSTPQGNIGPVSEALLATLGATQTVYVPSFPENGRTVYRGHLFVGDQPLDESPMRDHPLTPMRDSSLLRLLAPQVSAPVGLVRLATVHQGAAAISSALAALRAEGVPHAIVDAVENGDLAAIAEATQHLPLLTGGSALAMFLPALYRAAGLIDRSLARPTPPRLRSAGIVLSGSCSAMTRAQVARFAARVPSHRLDPLELAADGTALHSAHTWLAAQPDAAPKLIYATAEPDAVRKAQDRLGRGKAGEIVEHALAELAKAALERGTDKFVVAGGETSGAVTQALGVDKLQIGREIAPGVPWTYARAANRDIALALKSGNFGDENFFVTALAAVA